jgi:hypothetical protein
VEYPKRLTVTMQICWAFSIYLEAVAILPQLVLLQRCRNVDNLTGQYVFFLGYEFLLHVGNSWFCLTLVNKACITMNSVEHESLYVSKPI